MELNRQPRNKPCIYGQLINDKGARNIQWGMDGLFKKMVLGKPGSPRQENETQSLSYINHKNQFNMY